MDTFLDTLHKKIHIILFSFFILTLFVLIRNAWIGDDAYITFRTVDNFVNGYGLTWNVSERVQSYTHPLWMFVISFVYFFTDEMYFSITAVSIIISLVSMILLTYKISVDKTTGFFMLLLLLSSKNFIDYTTSGLENPLTYLLLVLFYYIYFKKEDSDKKFLMLCLICSLAMVNRLDTALLYSPVLLHLFFQRNIFKSIKLFLIGFLPFLCWELFSIIYYGFFVPNTAYAKLSTGIAKSALLKQGWHYIESSIVWSPVTLIVIIAALVFAVKSREKRFILPAIGVFLYVLYVVKIGGGYMTGRFFTAPFLVSVILLSRFKVEWKSKQSAVIALMFAVTIFFPYGSPILSGADIGESKIVGRWKHGISDERAGWYNTTGLLVQNTDSLVPNHKWVIEGLKCKEAGIKYIERPGIGLYGFYAGPDVYIADNHGLANALLARLPTKNKTEWRIGHFWRNLPEGYEESKIYKKNLIADPELHIYYDKLEKIMTGDIFSRERLKTIIEMNLGMYDSLLESYIKRNSIHVYSEDTVNSQE